MFEAPNLSTPEAVRLANALGLRGIVARAIDGAKLKGKADLLRAVAAEHHFPDYFGNNWDALIDCWSDMSWLPAKGYVTLILHADTFQSAHAKAHDELVTVCNDVAERWHGHDVTLALKLVRGVGAPAKAPAR